MSKSYQPKLLSARIRFRILSVALVGVLALGAAACSPRMTIRGNLPDPDRLSQVETGKHTRQQVFQLLGSPSTTTSLGGEAWLYVAERTATVAFLEPEVWERKVVVLRFDDKGVVSDIRTLSMDEGKRVKHVERTTPTAGTELTLFDQLIGNLGRFEQ